ncbi:MAG TPA: EAL domain-containing protein [Xanthobacteraceae bacterium]|nr:EAL domain-containing protein [Xanthobacteraceae bacterium]
MMRKSFDVFALLASLVALIASGYALYGAPEFLLTKVVLVAAGFCVLATAIIVVELRILRATQADVTTALNNISHGMCMFDATGRLVLSNERYIEMYKLSPDVVKPGCTLRDLLVHRKSVGMFSGDVDEYIAGRNKELATGETETVTVELDDGRIMTTVSQPLKGGGWVATHEDVTALHLRERELAQTRSFLNTVIDNVPTAISVKNAHDLRYALINRAGEEIYGVERDQMIGKTVHELFPDRSMETIEVRDRAALEAATVQSYPDHVYHSPTKGPRIHAARRVPVLDEYGKPLYLLLVIQDMTEQRAAEARAAYLYRHDTLTELPNRAAFNDHLNDEITQRRGTDRMLAVLCADFDHFKDINDVYGNAVGDELLKAVAKRLSEAAEGAFVARLGGDEFAFVIADDRLPTSAAALGDRLLEAMAAEFNIQGHSLRMGLSIGVATYPNDGADHETLLANANAALYRAKSGGRGSMRFFEAKMDDQLRERRSLTQDLRSAIEHKELVIHYQPQARINAEIVGFEALVRWNHPTQGQIPPTMFVPLAEENGLIHEMGEWIMREACREAASWTKPLRIAVNLSAAQFRHGDLVGLVHSVLLSSGLPASRLEIEITESMLADDFSRAASILRRLKALGVHIAMDDFGTGYSSLQNLQSLSFDKLKIDRSFINNVESNQHSATIVRAVIGLSRGLGLPTVAEGVETQAQLDFLMAESCDEVQGYLIGRPLPIVAYADVVGGGKAGGTPRVKKAVA